MCSRRLVYTKRFSLRKSPTFFHTAARKIFPWGQLRWLVSKSAEDPVDAELAVVVPKTPVFIAVRRNTMKRQVRAYLSGQAGAKTLLPEAISPTLPPGKYAVVIRKNIPAEQIVADIVTFLEKNA